MFMNNFTRSGSEARYWLSTTNLSCCSIDSITKQIKSLKVFSFIALFLFSVGAMQASNFIDGCMSDAPAGPSEAAIALTAMENCGSDAEIEVIKTSEMISHNTPGADATDCDWEIIHSYHIKCNGVDQDPLKIHYFGGDTIPPSLDGELPPDIEDFNACFADAGQAGYDDDYIKSLFSDNCGTEVTLQKSGTPVMIDNCSWTAEYKYIITDACNNSYPEFTINVSGRDQDPPELGRDLEGFPTSEYDLDLCFESKREAPEPALIASFYEDFCGGPVIVTQTGDYSKGYDCKWMAIYTYSIQDQCGNFVEPALEITYTGRDQSPYVINGVPENTTVDCIDQIPGAPDVTATDNCEPFLDRIDPVEDYSNVDACNGGIFTRTWTVPNQCGEPTVKVQEITVLPTPLAELTPPELPSNITCEEGATWTAPDATYTNNVLEGACAVSGSIEASYDRKFDECGGYISVSFNGKDECNRDLSAGPFMITVDPAPMAEFDEPEALELTCEEANVFQASSLGYSNNGTGSCEISGSVPGVAVPNYDYCGGEIVVNWTYKDDCNRDIYASVTHTVLAAPMAEFDEPEALELTCEEANVFQASSLGYSNNGTGSCEISGSVPGVAVPNYDYCGGEIVVNWTYKDDCNRDIYASVTHTVLAAPMAEFDEPEALELTCEEANVFQASSLGYSNDGTGLCEISGSVPGVATPNYDYCGGEIVVNWTYKDECDRDIYASVTHTVLAAPMAEFDEPEALELTCEEANVFQASSLGYSNDGTGLCEISGSVPGVATPNYDYCGGEIVVNWTYKDECDRDIYASVTHTVLAAPMAEFDEPEALELTCEEANVFQASSLGYSNDGTGLCEISGSVPGVATPNYDYCGGEIVVNRTYKDECDRDIYASVTHTVLAAPMAEFDEPEALELTCEEANVFQASSLGYSNDGTGLCEISGSVPGVATPNYDYCGGEIVVNWTYKDECDRDIYASVTHTVLAAPMAEFDEPEALELTCEEANVFQASSLGYSNDGTGLCEISGSVPGVATPNYDYCGGEIVVNWTYKDECDRDIYASVTHTVLAAPMAEFDEPEALELTCEEANVFQASSLGYSNDGTGLCEISGSVPGVATPNYDYCGGEIVVNWTYKDECDRDIYASVTHTVLAAPMAEFDEPEALELTCEEANVFQASSLGYSNDGTGLCEISGSVPGVATPNYDYCGGEIVVNWTYKDECDRDIYASVTHTVLAAPMAEFDEPEALELTCEEANVFQASSLGYSNDGTGLCEISGSVPGVATPNYDYCGGEIVVNWTYKDECDRDIYASVTHTVLAAPMAEFDEPEALELTCEEANVFQASSLGYSNDGTGLCEISGSVPGVATPNYDYCGGEIVVNWTYKDECDRDIYASVTHTVLAAPMAEFDEPEALELTCEEANVFQASSLGYSNDGTGLCEISGSVPGVATPNYDYCGGEIVVNWTYKDECDRDIYASVTHTVLAAPMAEFDEPEALELTCEEANVFQASSLGYSNDGTGLCEISGSVPGVATPNYDYCGGEIVVNWTYKDECDRDIYASVTHTVLAAPMAEFDEPEALELTCEEANVFQASSLGYSNDGTGLCEISGSVPGVATPNYDYCGGEIVVNWTYKDECDRDIYASVTHTVLAAPMAEFDQVNPVTIQCEDLPFTDLELGYSNTGTGLCQIIGTETGVIDNTGFNGSCGKFYVNWTYIDDCDRTITAQQEVTVEDNNIPFLNEGVVLEVGESDIDACLAGMPPAPYTEEELEGLYSDTCGNVNVTLTTVNPEGNNDCQWVVGYIYTIQDDCENFALPVKIYYNGGDKTPPVQTGQTPMGRNTLDLCIDASLEELGVPEPGDVVELFEDNCGEVLTADSIERTEKITMGNDCEWIRVFEYVATDACGNKSLPMKINYSGGDKSAPTSTGVCDGETMTIKTSDFDVTCPGELTTDSISLNIGDEIDVLNDQWSVGGITIEDMIGNVTLDNSKGLVPCFADNCASIEDLTYRVIGKGIVEGDCSTTLTVTFEVEDNCTNVSLPFVCTFVVIDDTAPVITCPAGEDFGLVDDTPVFADSVPYTDNCQPDGNTTDFEDDLSSVLIVAESAPIDGCEGPFSFQGFDSFGDGWNGTSIDVLVNGIVVITAYDLAGSDGATGATVPIPASPGDIVSTAINTDGSFDSEVSYEITDGSANVLATGGNPAVIEGFAICFDNGGDLSLDYTLVRTFTADDGCGNTSTCDITYTWSEPTSRCELGAEIACGDIVNGDSSTGEVHDISCVTSLNTAPGLWYTIIGTGDNVTVSTCSANTTFDTKMGVFAGCDTENSCITGNDDAGSACTHSNLHSTSTFSTVIGEEYKIYVTGFSDNAGDFELSVTCEAPVVTREATSNIKEDVVIDFRAYPVPFDKEVNIAYTFEFETNVTIELFDTKGLLILSETNERYVAGSKDKTTFDLSRISNQMFYVKLTTSQGSVTKKIVSSSKNRR